MLREAGDGAHGDLSRQAPRRSSYRADGSGWNACSTTSIPMSSTSATTRLAYNTSPVSFEAHTPSLALPARPSSHRHSKSLNFFPSNMPLSFPYVNTSSASLSGGTRRSAAASRILSTVRRSLSYNKKREDEYNVPGMYSTPEERSYSPSNLPFPKSSAEPPSIEQIAMGLHTSRTPHLRPARRHNSVASSTRTSSRSAHLLPPTRSSLKKSSTETSLTSAPSLSASTSTSTSTSTSGPSSNGPSALTRLRKSLLHPLSLTSGSSKSSSSFYSRSASISSSRPSVDSWEPETPRKAVRFSTSVVDLEQYEDDGSVRVSILPEQRLSRGQDVKRLSLPESRR